MQLSNSESGGFTDNVGGGVGGDTMAFASRQRDQSAQDREILRRKFQSERLFDVVHKPNEVTSYSLLSLVLAKDQLLLYEKCRKEKIFDF